MNNWYQISVDVKRRCDLDSITEQLDKYESDYQVLFDEEKKTWAVFIPMWIHNKNCESISGC